MENIGICYIVIVVLIVLNIIVIYVAMNSAHSLPDDFDMYNEDGDHIYYDRKLIRHKLKTKQNEEKTDKSR